MTPHIKFPFRPLTLVTGLNGAGQAPALAAAWESLPAGAITFTAHASRTINEYRRLLPASKDLSVAPLLQRPQVPNDLPEQLRTWLELLLPVFSEFEGRHRCNPYDSIWTIILCGLAARPGNFFYVEAPELYLHPRAQTLIGDFLCRVAASGVTVIVETQSDHVFNAVRLAVKSKIIPCADVNVYFFSSTEGEKPVRTVEQLQINKDGRMDHWPDGFFDEWDCSLDKLLTANETHEES